MIKNIKFTHNSTEVEFKLDTELFTKEHAIITLDFYSYDYDEDAEEEELIIEVLKKYAIAIITLATLYSLNANNIISAFEDQRFDGFAKLDGSIGLTLLSVTPYNFEEIDFSVEIN